MLQSEIILEAIQSIPSVALKENLLSNLPNWSLMQAATIAANNMEMPKAAEFFRKLISFASEQSDINLLQAAINDIAQLGYIGEPTNALFDQTRKSKVFPLFPFIELCHLPVLFKPGDLISCPYNHQIVYACVEALPVLKAGSCDYSDESYYCHNIECPDPKKEIETGISHLHIPICHAEYVDEAALTSAQKSKLSEMRIAIQNNINK